MWKSGICSWHPGRMILPNARRLVLHLLILLVSAALAIPALAFSPPVGFASTSNKCVFFNGSYNGGTGRCVLTIEQCTYYGGQVEASECVGIAGYPPDAGWREFSGVMQEACEENYPTSLSRGTLCYIEPSEVGRSWNRNRTSDAQGCAATYDRAAKWSARGCYYDVVVFGQVGEQRLCVGGGGSWQGHYCTYITQPTDSANPTEPTVPAELDEDDPTPEPDDSLLPTIGLPQLGQLLSARLTRSWALRVPLACAADVCEGIVSLYVGARASKAPSPTNKTRGRLAESRSFSLARVRTGITTLVVPKKLRRSVCASNGRRAWLLLRGFDVNEAETRTYRRLTLRPPAGCKR